MQKVIKHASDQRMSAQEKPDYGETIEISDKWWNRLNALPFVSCKSLIPVVGIIQMSILFCAEHKGKTLHLLK